MSWSPERIDALRRMWLAGETSTDIANALGGVTRNAVMGKVHRLGLMGSAEHNSRMRAAPTGCCRPKGAEAEAVSALVDVAPVPIAAAAPELVAAPSVATPPPDPVLESIETIETIEEVGTLDDVPAIDEIRPIVFVPPSIDQIPEKPVPERMAKSGSARIRTSIVAREADGPDPYAAFIRARLVRKSVMPQRQAAVAPTVIVTISIGTMTRVAASPHSGWGEASAFLRDLTGVEFDRRVRGHLPALVGIATVLAKGDPRTVLCPRLDEPDVLRLMREMAVNGMVIAGKAPVRWLDPETGDDDFWTDMLSLDPRQEEHHAMRGVFA